MAAPHQPASLPDPEVTHLLFKYRDLTPDELAAESSRLGAEAKEARRFLVDELASRLPEVIALSGCLNECADAAAAYAATSAALRGKSMSLICEQPPAWDQQQLNAGAASAEGQSPQLVKSAARILAISNAAMHADLVALVLSAPAYLREWTVTAAGRGREADAVRLLEAASSLLFAAPRTAAVIKATAELRNAALGPLRAVLAAMLTSPDATLSALLHAYGLLRRAHTAVGAVCDDAALARGFLSARLSQKLPLTVSSGENDGAGASAATSSAAATSLGNVTASALAVEYVRSLRGRLVETCTYFRTLFPASNLQVLLWVAVNELVDTLVDSPPVLAAVAGLPAQELTLLSDALGGFGVDVVHVLMAAYESSCVLPVFSKRVAAACTASEDSHSDSLHGGQRDQVPLVKIAKISCLKNCADRIRELRCALREACTIRIPIVVLPELSLRIKHALMTIESDFEPGISDGMELDKKFEAERRTLLLEWAEILESASKAGTDTTEYSINFHR